MPCPYLTLGVAESATNEEIRQAYLRAARAYPPDREPERFQAIHEAYARVRDEEVRARLKLFGLPPQESTGPLSALVPGHAGERKRIGIDRWLEAARVQGAEQAAREAEAEAEAERKAIDLPEDADELSLLEALLDSMPGMPMPGPPMPGPPMPGRERSGRGKPSGGRPSGGRPSGGRPSRGKPGAAMPGDEGDRP